MPFVMLQIPYQICMPHNLDDFIDTDSNVFQGLNERA